jgi:AbrB family looped-hinge helix DNA binding protein
MTVSAIEVRLGPKNQVVIPKAVRDTLQVKEGDALLFVLQGNTVLLRARPASFTDALRGLHKEVWEGEDIGQWLAGEREAARVRAETRLKTPDAVQVAGRIGIRTPACTEPMRS